MNDDTILIDTAERLFGDLVSPTLLNAAEAGSFPHVLWSALEDHGMTLAAVPEAEGGAGASIQEAFDLVRVAARHGAPIPLAETLLAGWALSGAGLRVPLGPLTVVVPGEQADLTLTGAPGHWQLNGQARRVPFARAAGHLVALVAHQGQTGVVCLPAARCRLAPDDNLAGESRDTVEVEGVSLTDTQVALIATGVTGEGLFRLGALARVVQMAGALERCLTLAVNYVNERVQFGRPLAKFQAIQHHVATLAGEVSAATVAADAAVRVLAAHGIAEALLEIACAKIRTGEAVGVAAALVHQVHGAMGFTQEYPLHFMTRRLWSWRDEFGNEAYWADQLAGALLPAGGDALWPALTRHAGIAQREG